MWTDIFIFSIEGNACSNEVGGLWSNVTWVKAGESSECVSMDVCCVCLCVGQSSSCLTIDCSAIGRCSHMSKKGSTMYPWCPNSVANFKEPKSWSCPEAPSVWPTGKNTTASFPTLFSQWMLREAAALMTNLWSVNLLILVLARSSPSTSWNK